MNGIIFTDLTALSDKFGCFKSDLVDLMERFIRGKERFGVHYRLVDISDYKNEIEDCRDILMDIHRKEVEQGLPVSDYLFIIGANDIVPVPCVDYYVPGQTDKHIDTDILYAYPQCRDAEALLKSGKLFEEEALFHVGRLPIGEDVLDSEVSEIEDIVIYLQKSMNFTEGIPMTKAYAQVDSRWKAVSEQVVAGLSARGFLPDGLTESPAVNAENLNDVFPADASLYYYNLRSSHEWEKSGYAARTSSGDDEEVIGTMYHMGCRNPNVIISEGSYGARFIDLEKENSMVLSAVYARTLLFYGASRTTWGSEEEPVCADLFARSVIDALLEGYTAGQALLIARASLLASERVSWEYVLTTLTEFNLLGDPTLYLRCGASAGELQLDSLKMFPAAAYTDQVKLTDKTSR